jgi:phosphatidylglycerophosphate synthase
MQEIEAVLLANSPDCLTHIGGISLLERLLRTLQRLGFQRATVVSATPEIIRAELARPSWAREKVIVDLAEQIPQLPGRLLIVPANVYCDARLLRALCQKPDSAELRDSNPPDFARALIENPCGPRLQGPGKIDIVEAGEVDDYIASMRRHLRPVCIHPSKNIRLAERIVLDSAQKGTLDIPALVHAPIEKWIVSFLCRTRITPNQITLFTALLSAMVTLQFAFGWLWSGTLLALVVGILDGLDGKQARVKVETTELGEWEHAVDAVLEASWWLALALHFRATGEVSMSILLVIALLLGHVADGFARRFVQRATGRSLDDLNRFDRALRLIGGRRNIYIWIFAISLLLDAPAKGFLWFCVWGMASSAIYVARALWIRLRI